jgi:hypothetical protein
MTEGFCYAPDVLIDDLPETPPRTGDCSPKAIEIRELDGFRCLCPTPRKRARVTARDKGDVRLGGQGTQKLPPNWGCPWYIRAIWMLEHEIMMLIPVNILFSQHTILLKRGCLKKSRRNVLR